MIASGFAPAKINLYLHVAPPRADGLHPLDSFVVFAADAGDFVSAEDADALSLNVTGPFGGALSSESDNLVLQAARALAREAGMAARAALHLEKDLPIASGIGGGSSDAAATLRVLNRLWRLNAGEDDLCAIAAMLGADVPACVRARPVRMLGIGEKLRPVAEGFDGVAVLVNPLTPAPTRDVYRAFDALGAGRALEDLSGLPAERRNDLTAAAIQVAPAISETLATLRLAAPTGETRLSGSGATCFVLLDNDFGAARRIAGDIAQQQPHWWVRPTRLGAVDVTVTER